jgi:hypothetical protein
MNGDASPRPWRVEGPFPGQRETKRQHGFSEYANVLDRNGIYIAQNLPPETAALIVDAVNGWTESARKLVKSEADLYNETKKRVAAEAERDRLRDIVRRLVRVAINDRETLRHINSDTQYATDDDDAIGDALREARAAIGEGEACE